MGNYIFYLKWQSQRKELYSPEYVSEFIRDEDELCVCRELHRSRLFREFAIEKFMSPSTPLQMKLTVRSTTSTHPIPKPSTSYLLRK